MSEQEKVVTRLRFGHGTCAQHRAFFVNTLIDKGIRDWVLMERIRLRVIAECGRHLPEDLVRAYLSERCIGCEMLQWVIPVIDRVALEEKAYHDEVAA